MISVSGKIHELLESKLGEEIANDYAMDIHSIIISLDNAFSEIRQIIVSVKNRKYITSEENIKIQDLIRRIMDNYYRFSERMEIFCNDRLSKCTGKKYSPSFHENHGKILPARGSSVHIRESILTFERRSENNYTCNNNGPFNSYEGECIGIIVTFYKKDGVTIFSKDLDFLICDITGSIKHTLTKLEGYIAAS